MSTNILPSFRVDYSSKEGAVEISIFKTFGSKSLDITLRLAKGGTVSTLFIEMKRDEKII